MHALHQLALLAILNTTLVQVVAIVAQAHALVAIQIALLAHHQHAALATQDII